VSCDEHPRVVLGEAEVAPDGGRAVDAARGTGARASDQRFLSTLLADVGLAAHEGDEPTQNARRERKTAEFSTISRQNVGGCLEEHTEASSAEVVRLHAHEVAQDPTLWRDWIAADTMAARVTRQAAILPEIRSYFAYPRLPTTDRASFDTLLRVVSVTMDLTLVDEAAITPPAFSALMRFVATELYAMRIGALHGVAKRRSFVLTQTKDKIFGPFRDEIAALGPPGGGDAGPAKRPGAFAAMRAKQMSAAASAGNAKPAGAAAATSAKPAAKPQGKPWTKK
jgi:hypothetical protein